MPPFPGGGIVRLRNPIRNYAWGSRTAIAELLGNPSPSAEPEAELWIGAHPLAPSKICVDGVERGLDEVIAEDPVAALGAEVAQRFGGVLPFLMKVIAVEAPLSLQVHPDSDRAAAGFARENAAGIPLDAPERCHSDPHAKPELVCALTPFVVLCGFRPAEEIVVQFDELRAGRVAALLGEMRVRPGRESIRRFFGALMALQGSDRDDLVGEVVETVECGRGDALVRGWVRKLAEAHPGDPCVLSPLFLDMLKLQAGEALFLPPGQPHAYLHGLAVEIMASSNNVLRAGLTSKHVDVPEFLAALDFESRRPEVLTPRPLGPLESVYDTPAREFALGVLRPHPDTAFDSARDRSVEALFCTEGEVVIREAGSGDETQLARGSAAFVPAASEGYHMRGDARVFRATVPLEHR